MNSLLFRGLGSVALLATLALPAAAQFFPQQGAPAQNVCVRLEAQLAAIDRGAADPARADQIRRYEEAASRQQAELDRAVAQSRRNGCEQTGFFLFNTQPAQCQALNNQIAQMRRNLDVITNDTQRLQTAPGFDQNSQRRQILAALGQNDCGPQYRVATPAQQPRGFFDTLFGGFGNNQQVPDVGPSGTYRTICVRTCDGFYFPISFAATPAKFAEDERTCQRMCPASEAILFSHRNPGEEVAQAVSSSGKQYSQLPTAFRYRQEYNAACSCRRQGESWADAMKALDDRTVARGDILVTEDRAKAMAAPTRDAQGRPIRTPPAPLQRSAGAAQQPAQPAPEPAAAPEEPATQPKGPVRTIGPQFLPTR